MYTQTSNPSFHLFVNHLILEVNAYYKNNIYPIYEIRLDKFNNFKRNQQTDWNKIIEENDKSQEIQSKVACSTICQKTKQIKTFKTILKSTHIKCIQSIALTFKIIFEVFYA